MYKNGKCDCCGSENVPVKNGVFTVIDSGGFHREPSQNRCVICGDTEIQAVFNDKYSSHQEKIIPAIVIVGNLILKELAEIRKELKPKQSPQKIKVLKVEKPGKNKK